MTHIMVDLETADSSPTSAIISIGAVEFSGQGVTSNTFYCAVDMGSAVAAGLTVSHDTMAWWSKQSEQARAVFDDPRRVSLVDALNGFAAWLPDGTRLWGNGAAFDNAILANAYGRIGITLPWKFWNDRCYRTIAATTTQRRAQTGTHHNALDDAISQAQHLSEIGRWAL